MFALCIWNFQSDVCSILYKKRTNVVHWDRARVMHHHAYERTNERSTRHNNTYRHDIWQIDVHKINDAKESVSHLKCVIWSSIFWATHQTKILCCERKIINPTQSMRLGWVLFYRISRRLLCRRLCAVWFHFVLSKWTKCESTIDTWDHIFPRPDNLL